MSGELGVRLLPTTTPTWPPRALKQPTFEEMLRRFAGAIPQPFDPDTYRCETIDGVSLDPTEAFASAVVNKVRRVVVNAKGVVTDMRHRPQLHRLRQTRTTYHRPRVLLARLLGPRHQM